MLVEQGWLVVFNVGGNYFKNDFLITLKTPSLCSSRSDAGLVMEMIKQTIKSKQEVERPVHIML